MFEQFSRRRFIAQATAGGAGLWLSQFAFEPEYSAVAVAKDSAVPSTELVPIVDTHQHLWDLSLFELPWHKSPEVASLAKSFVTADYLKAVEGLNVVKSVYMEVDVTPSQQSKEADYVIDLCERGNTPMVAAVISGRPNSPEFKPYATKYSKSKFIKGVRQVLHGPETPAGYCVDSKFVDGIKLLGDLNLSFDFCMRSGELLDAVKVVDQCPQTRFIVDHCGNISAQATDGNEIAIWKKGMKELAGRKNVVCKISGIVASAKPGAWKAQDLAPHIKYSMEVFGPDRVMFGGDWPVCTLTASYQEWVQALKLVTMDLSQTDRKKLFHDNAVKFYGL